MPEGSVTRNQAMRAPRENEEGAPYLLRACPVPELTMKRVP